MNKKIQEILDSPVKLKHVITIVVFVALLARGPSIYIYDSQKLHRL